MYRSVSPRYHQDSYTLWVLIWLHITKVIRQAKLCYADTNSLVLHVKSQDDYADLAKYVERRFDISIFEVDRSLPKRNNKNVTGLMKVELGEKIMKEFVALRLNIY